MDKTELLNYFLEHHLSRQEVLFRLPLNIPANTFWAELSDLRKAKAVFLPLHNADGAAYWYMLTDRMVRASQRLCEEALLYVEPYDPYRTSMTAAMTQEMFFTSYVEGASISIENALAYLDRDREPENIQEQMLWNNRRSWEVMVKNLYRPMDESFVRALVMLLTEGMDHGGGDYRSWNHHPIAAMQGEAYNVPIAAVIPDRMTELYTFMKDVETHPLIKAATAQAFVLTIRPFPEGNERLGRMLSSAILLRSGYQFFQNISISAVIAKESFHYYKSMREILRSDNGGDLTYFIEYYLELLVRALENRDAHDRKRTVQVIDAEQKMSCVPLAGDTDSEHTVEEAGIITENLSGKSSTPGQVASMNLTFAEQPADERIIAGAAKSTEDVNKNFWKAVTDFATSRSNTLRQCASFIHRRIKNGQMSFTRADLLTEFDSLQIKTLLEQFRRREMVKKTGMQPVFEYHFRTDRYEPLSVDDQNTKDIIVVPSVDISENMTIDQILQAFSEQPENTRDWRIAVFLLQCRKQDTEVFTTKDWAGFFGINSNIAKRDEERAVGLGLIYEAGRSTANRSAVYGVCRERRRNVTLVNTTEFQKRLLTSLYLEFQDRSFLTADCIDVLNMSVNTISYHLSGFADRGILSSKRIGTKNIYSFIIVPNDHPECFDLGLLQEESDRDMASISEDAAPVGSPATIEAAQDELSAAGRSESDAELFSAHIDQDENINEGIT